MTCTLMPIESSKSDDVLFRGKLNQGRSNQRIPALAPGVQPALQRPDAPHAFAPQEQRHTGAGSLVWSSAVKNDFTVRRQAVILLFQIFGVYAKGAGYGMWVGLELHGMPQVHDNEIFSCVDLLLQFLCRDARNAQFAQKALPRNEL